MSPDLASEPTVAPQPTQLERGVALVSGKGGVGKTNLVANLAVALARVRSRVLVVDGDLSLANVDVLLGLVPPRTIGDVLEGTCRLEDAIVRGPHGLELLPAATARPDLAALGRRGVEGLVGPLVVSATAYDLVLVDAGAGIGPTVVSLAGACARVVVVTTPEPTSLADAYATLKVLWRREPQRPLEILVNSARSEREARESYEHLRRLSERFLGIDVRHLGSLPRDPKLAEAVVRQRAVVDLYPNAPSSRRLVALAERLMADGAEAGSPQGRVWRRVGVRA